MANEYDEFKTKFARALRVAAANRDMKLIEVAKAAEISEERIYSYAHGKSLPNAYFLAKRVSASRIILRRFRIPGSVGNGIIGHLNTEHHILERQP